MCNHIETWIFEGSSAFLARFFASDADTVYLRDIEREVYILLAIVHLGEEYPREMVVRVVRSMCVGGRYATFSESLSRFLARNGYAITMDHVRECLQLQMVYAYDHEERYQEERVIEREEQERRRVAQEKHSERQKHRKESYERFIKKVAEVVAHIRAIIQSHIHTVEDFGEKHEAVVAEWWNHLGKSASEALSQVRDALKHEAELLKNRSFSANLFGMRDSGQ